MELGVIEWYCNENSLDILGFYPYERGFYIIGGLTGSHHSGHCETAYDKESQLRAKGYIPVKNAIENGILNQNWQEPKIRNYKDRRIIAHIDKIEGYLRYQHLKPWWVFT